MLALHAAPMPHQATCHRRGRLANHIQMHPRLASVTVCMHSCRSVHCGMQAASTDLSQPTSQAASDQTSRALQVQAAKVVSAHAATIGDNLLGVPLLWSAGKTYLVTRLQARSNVLSACTLTLGNAYKALLESSCCDRQA